MASAVVWIADNVFYLCGPLVPTGPLAQLGTRHRTDSSSGRFLAELRLVSAFLVDFTRAFLLNMTRVGVIKYMDLVRSPVNQHTGYHESILILYEGSSKKKGRFCRFSRVLVSPIRPVD